MSPTAPIRHTIHRGHAPIHEAFLRTEVISLFKELADLAPAARSAYYASRKVPAELRDEVESLLRFDRTGESLTGHVAHAAEEAFEANGQVSNQTTWGPYRVVRPLGNGGMGAVYLAERTDGEVEQLVAIKVVRSGAASPAFLERFLRERRILAALNHPGIARLLDAGRTADGQPYLAMEFVDGVTIDTYCAGLDLREVLNLFLAVCEAVSYAHRNLVVHRDLKPSNILVDSSGNPKLLDFGIATILDASENSRTVVRILTPEYASPEQMRGEAYSIATDIYSLGAVLHKLLAPEAERPSDPPADAAQSGIPRDIASVLRKALRAETEERYPTVDAFAEDIRAYLDNRPVRARAGNAWYRARKFVRRYWVPVTAGAVAIISLTAGLYIANRERSVAEQRFLQVRQLASRVFDIDAAIRNTPGTTKGRQLIVSTSLDYLRKAGAEVRGDKGLALELGSEYVQLAHVQGVPVNANLGEFAQAEESLRRADELVNSVLAKDPADPRALLTSATIAHDRMVTAGTQNRRAESLRFALDAGSKLDRITSLGHLSSEDTGEISFMYSNVAVTFTDSRRFDDAVRYSKKSIDLAKQIKNSAGQQSLAYGILAEALRQTGDLDGALTAVRESRRFQEKVSDPGLAPQRANLALALWREGSILGEDGDISLDKPDEAEPVLREGFEIADDLASKDADEDLDHQLAAEIARRLGDIVRHKNPQQALAIYDAAIARVRHVKNPNIATRRTQAALLASSSYPELALHHSAEAKRRIDAALDLLRQAGDYPAAKAEPGGEAYLALQALADFQSVSGEDTSAAATWNELLEKMKVANSDPEKDLHDAVYISHVWSALARIQRESGLALEAANREGQRRNLWEHWSDKLPNNPFIRKQLASAH